MTGPSPLGGVLFDMDGVLVDTNPFHRCAWRRFCCEVRRSVSEADLRQKVFGWRTEEGIVNLWGGRASDRTVKAMAARKEEIFRQIARSRLKAMPGLEAFLAWLREAGLQLALATSACTENVELVLDRLGIAGFFAATVLAGEVGRGKPHPGVFLLAARRLGLEQRECLVIEDSLSGVAAAKCAGMLCVALSTTHDGAELKAAGADLVCRDFRSQALREFVGASSCWEPVRIRRRG